MARFVVVFCAPCGRLSNPVYGLSGVRILCFIKYELNADVIEISCVNGAPGGIIRRKRLTPAGSSPRCGNVLRSLRSLVEPCLWIVGGSNLVFYQV